MKELQLDEELNKDLNTPADVNAIKQEFEDLSDKIEAWGQNIADQFENLSSATQTLTNELKTLLNEVKEQVSQLSTTSLPLDVEVASSSIYNLQQKFEQASLKIDQEI
jgi:gas vesicle protein